eukprot:3915330-Prymnesium_polylepis.1
MDRGADVLSQGQGMGGTICYGKKYLSKGVLPGQAAAGRSHAHDWSPYGLLPRQPCRDRFDPGGCGFA